MRGLLLSAAALPLLWGATAVAAEPGIVINIPLEKIWAANMPGTRDIRDLEPRMPGDRRKYGPLMTAIYRELMTSDRQTDAGRAFVVRGHDIEALNDAYDVVFTGRWEAPEVVPAGKISLVFYVKWSGQYVYLEKAERQGTTITLQHRFVVHRPKEITAHAAIISLGELKAGTYEVLREQLPVRFPDNEQGPVFGPPHGQELVERLVSRSFSFEVE